jgi:hypothetical protein
LKHVEHWTLSTREEAVSVFQQKSALGEFAATAAKEPSPHHSANSLQNGGDAATSQAVYLSNVLVYPNHSNNHSSSNTHQVASNNSSASTTATPPPPPHEHWSSTGSTEVDVLVLRPQHTQTEHIAAVAPYCAPGMTTRDIDSLDGHRNRMTTIRLGIFEIVYQTSVTLKQEEADASSSTTTSTTAVILSAPAKVLQSGTNILHNMQLNAQLLYQATQEDYPQRCLQASQRITAEFENTFDRTVGLMKRVVTLFEDDDNDNNNNDQHESSGKKK